MKLLSYDDLRGKGIPYSKVQIWRLEKASKFPKRVPLGPARNAWVDSEIDQWIEQRMASRNDAAAARRRIARKAPSRAPLTIESPGFDPAKICGD